MHPRQTHRSWVALPPPLPPPIVLQPMYQIASLLYASGKTQYTQVHVVTRAFFRGRVGGASTCIRDSSTCAASRESEPQVKRDSSYPHLSGAYGPFEGAVEGEHEDAEPQPHQPTRDTPVTLARLWSLISIPPGSPRSAALSRWSVHRSAARSSCASPSSSSPCPADKCRRARRCALCSSPCIRAPSGSPKPRSQVTVLPSRLVRVVASRVLRAACAYVSAFSGCWDFRRLNMYVFPAAISISIQFWRKSPLRRSSLTSTQTHSITLAQHSSTCSEKKSMGYLQIVLKIQFEFACLRNLLGSLSNQTCSHVYSFSRCIATFEAVGFTAISTCCQVCFKWEG